MLNINNNTSNIKREILVRIAKLQFEGKLEEGVHYIPREMVPQILLGFSVCNDSAISALWIHSFLFSL